MAQASIVLKGFVATDIQEGAKGETPVVSFQMPMESGKDAQGNYKPCNVWAKITVWGKQAEYVKRVAQKGSYVIVEGKFKVSTYLKKDGGAPAASLDITASDVTIAPTSKNNNSNNNADYSGDNGEARTSTGRTTPNEASVF